MMTGYKTYLGAIIIGIGSAIEALGYIDLGRIVKDLGLMLMGIGIGAKIARLNGGVK